MSKHVKNALITAFIVWVTIATMGAINPAWAVANVGMTVAYAFGITLVSGIVGGLTSKGLNASAGNFGSKFATRAATAHRQLVYGECRVGGTIVHMETTGVDNYLLHAVVVLAGHEIQSLESVRLNDVTLTTGTSTISGSTVYTATNSDFINTDSENNFGSGKLARYSFQDGSQTAADGFAVAQSSLLASDQFRSCAYIYLQLAFDPEAFGGGVPAISCVIKGKKVFDPRDNSTAWSNNPALCIRDFVSNTQYGLKALTSEINDTTNAGGFATAANACEVDVTLADNSTTEDKYTANGFTNFGASGTGILESLLSSMAGKISYVNGQFNVFAGTTQTPSLTIADDNLLAPVNISTNTSTGELYNTVKPIYVDAANDYIAADAPVYQDSTFLTEDTPNGVTNDKPNYVKQMEKQLPFTTTHTMAQRIGRLALKNQRLTTSISCLVDLAFMKLQPADWVYVTNERLGYSQKIFEVISVNMEVIQSEETPVLGVRLILKETASSIYSFATSDYNANIAAGSNLASGGFVISAPSISGVATDTTTNDNLGTTSVTVTWVNSASPMVIFTDVQFKRNGAADATYTSTTASKGSTKQTILGLEIGVTYNFRVRHAGVAGSYSAFSSVVNHTVAGTAVATSALTNSLIILPTHTTGDGVPDNNTTPSPNPESSTYRRTGVTPHTLYISDGSDWILQSVNSDTDTNTTYVLPTWTTGGGVPANSTTPDPNPLGSSYLRTGVTPNTLYISNGSSWILQGINSDTDTTYTLPTSTTGTGTPSGGVNGSTYLQTGITPNVLWLNINGTWTTGAAINVDTDTNTTYVLPTWTTGSGVPSDSTTPSPNPLGSSYLRTGVTPNTLYISNGTSWVLQGVNSDTDTVYTLPDGVLIGHPTISGTTITFPSNDGGSSTVVTQDTNTTYTFEDSMTALPLGTAVWVTIDGASYSPAPISNVLRQDITVTYYNGISTASCTVRWIMENAANSNDDYISSCAYTGSSTGFEALASLTDLSGNDVKYATVVVEHAASNATITLSALISQTHVSGGGK